MFVDGGMSANGPALVGIIEGVRSFGKSVSEIDMLEDRDKVDDAAAADMLVREGQPRPRPRPRRARACMTSSADSSTGTRWSVSHHTPRSHGPRRGHRPGGRQRYGGPMSTTVPPSSTRAPLLSYRQRLVVYVVWHPQFGHGRKIADALCTHLNTPPTQPGGGGLGIPVLFRSHPTAGGIPRPIDFAEARNTAVVILVDDEMVAAVPGWDTYAEGLSNDSQAASRDGALHRIFPVRLSPDAFNLSLRLEAVNYIRPLDPPKGESSPHTGYRSA